MPNKRIDQLNPNLENLTGNEFIPIFDTSTNTTERITINTLSEFIDKDIFTTGTTLSGNTIVFDRNDLSGAYDVNLQPILDNYLSLTGGTLTGSLSATTYFGDGSNLSGISTDNFYTTGATLNGTILEFGRTDNPSAYTVDLSGITNSFTGQSLSQTLLIGNETGGESIIISEDSDISFQTIDFGLLTSQSIQKESTKSMLIVGDRLYFTNNLSYVIEVRDLNLNVIEQLYLPFTTNILRYNPTLNRIYIGVLANTSDRYYIDLSTGNLEVVSGVYVSSTGYMDYDPITNKIYSTSQSSTIDIYDENWVYEESIPTFSGTSGYYWLENNPNDNTLFLSYTETVDGLGSFLVFDKVTKTIIQRFDGLTNDGIDKIQYDSTSGFLFISFSNSYYVVYHFNGVEYVFVDHLDFIGEYKDIRVFDGKIVYSYTNNVNFSRLVEIDVNTNYGWDDLTESGLISKNYTNFSDSLNYQIGNLIVGTEMVMHHLNSNTFYKIKFTSWTPGSAGGGFSYERQLITPTLDEPIITFTKTDYGSEVDVIIPGELEITRGNSQQIYNSALESDPSLEEGPQGTRWNSVYSTITTNVLYTTDYLLGVNFGVIHYQDNYYIGSNPIDSGADLFKVGVYNYNGTLTSYVTEPRTWRLPDNSGTIALLSDIPTIDIRKYGRLLFVDKSYGDNMTAETNNPTKPYSTYLQASSVATSGDLIILRPGTYSENITLKDGVDVYCYENVNISGRITDGGLGVTCKFLGYATLTTNNTILITNSVSTSNIHIEVMDITNNSSVNSGISITTAGKVYIKCRNISATGTAANGISLYPNNSTNNIIIECDNITAGQYAIYLSNTPNARVIVKDTILLTRFSFGEYAGAITIIDSYNGNTFISAKKITSDASYGTILVSTTTIGGVVEVESELIESIVTSLPSVLVRGTISDFGPANLIVRAKKITSLGGHTYFSINVNPNSKTIISGDMYSESNYPIRVNGRKKVVFKDGIITRNGLLESNRLVTIGYPSGVGGIFNGQSNNLTNEFINVTFIREYTGGEPLNLDPIIAIDGDSSQTYVKNCEIIGNNLTEGVEAFYADTVPEGNIYFKNTVSNIDNNENITDISAVSGFILDPNINTLQ
jgi:hypothetical protein